MTDQLASPSIANPFDDQASDPELQQRIRLAGSRAPSSHIDGVWWPRSTQLADELPDLFATVHDSVGPVALVGYRSRRLDRRTAPDHDRRGAIGRTSGLRQRRAAHGDRDR